MPTKNDELLRGLMKDITGEDISVHKDKITETISNILHDYNLSTDLSFVEKIAKINFGKDNGSEEGLADVPKELKDAAFLPVNTIADIALRQDLDLIISQIPEWFKALQITRDAICEADTVDGKLARSIKFDRLELSDLEQENIMSKIEDVEERLELHSIIKNHLVFNTLEYGEGYVYAIPYSKVFQDLYKYRLTSTDRKTNTGTLNMFETSSALNGYGFGEGAVEISLNDAIVNDGTTNKSSKKKSKQHVFTEAEIMEINPQYRGKTLSEVKQQQDPSDQKQRQEFDDAYDEMINEMADNIRYINEPISLPVIEESAHDLRCVYEEKYRLEEKYIQEEKTLFDMIMEDGNETEDNEHETTIDKQFQNIRGIYLRILPCTKLIPIRVDRNIIGYYYISDMTRPEESGERRNSGLTGYTLRSPSVGYDTFSPDKMFCERLASKIINSFDLKFMRDNIALHQQIVAVLQSHKFNEAMMRFVFIPAEHVICCAINKDGIGKGHSMLEPGLVTARMYMFLKLYSILYQINNSQIRVYNVRTSGMDKNYQQFVQETMRKFAARRVTVNDIFNYRSSMTKVSGGSELIMPVGPGDKAPISIENIEAANSPINNELLEQFKNEAINSTPVPALMVQTGGESQIEFAKETELANTQFNTMISGNKIDMNWGVTQLYRRILRWETDIEPSVLKTLKFVFRMPTAKTLNVTAEMINNFNSLAELIIETFLTKEESAGKEENAEPGSSDTAREFKKLLLSEYIPQIDIDHMEELADQARNESNKLQMEKTSKQENILVNDGEGGFE